MEKPTLVSVTPLYLTAFSAGLPPVLINPYAVIGCPAFWGGIRYISETLAGLPLCVKQEKGKVITAVPDHPLTPLLNLQAGPGVKSYTVRQTWGMHAAWRGNGYLRIRRNGPGGAVRSLSTLYPDSVMPFKVDGEMFYRAQEPGGQPETLDSTEVAHIHLISYDGICGIDPVWALAPTFELAALIDQYSRTFLQKGGHFSGHIEFPTGATQDDIDATKANWKSHTGVMNSGSTPSLIGAKYVPAGTSNSDAQLTELHKQTINDIASILRLPPAVLYQFEKTTNTSAVQQSLEAIMFGLRNWMEQMEAELSVKLLTPQEVARGLRVRYDIGALLRGDPSTQAVGVANLVNGGIVTPNEGRGMLGLETVTDPKADQLREPVAIAKNTLPEPSAKDSGAASPT